MPDHFLEDQEFKGRSRSGQSLLIGSFVCHLSSSVFLLSELHRSGGC